MRAKESADDYRLFPDPDLSPFDLSDDFIDAVRVRLPELPDGRVKRYLDDLALPSLDARVIGYDIDLAQFFDESLEVSGKKEFAKPLANLLLNDVSAYLNSEQLKIDETKLSPKHLAELAELITEDKISSKQGKALLAEVFERGESPLALVKELGVEQVSDTGEIESIAGQVLLANPEKVAEYQAGKTGLLGFFVGQAMKASAGKANPKLLSEIIERLLSE